MRSRSKSLSGLPSSWFQVDGNCMAPLIRKDDLVMTVPVAEPTTGDIVVITGSQPVVHRVVKVLKGDLLLTKGDMSFSLDPPLSKDSIAGKVVAIARKEGKLVLIEGRLWQVRNYLTARYSMGCVSAWGLVRENKWLGPIGRRFSAPLKRVYISAAVVMARLTAVQRG